MNTRYRWWILALLTLGTTINYLDRIALGFLAKVMREDLHMDNKAYGLVQGSFQFAYTIGFLFAGALIDRYGVRLGYAVAAGWWSVAAMLHSLAGNAVHLGAWRALLGVGESGNFPSAIKAVAEWFPVKDRAFATGIFNAGTNVASMIGPLMFAAMAAKFGWRGCFLITGALGIAWMVVWWMAYYTPRQEGASGPPPAPMPWRQAVQHRETWGIALAKFFSDPVWWFYLFWLPIYFYDIRKWSMDELKWALPFIYLVADIGSVAGGWFSGFLIRRGWTVPRARKGTMLLCALCPPVAALAVLSPDPVWAVVLFSIAPAAHQGWSANLYTTISDVFPKRAVASVTGIGGFLGGLSGVIFSTVIPAYVLPHVGYLPLFLGMGCFYLFGLAALSWLVGRWQPLEPHT
jgi:ACS family hexuronate transporter-like MFS transporter